MAQSDDELTLAALPRNRKGKLRWIIALLVIVAIAVTGVVLARKEKAAKVAKEGVRTAEVKKGSLVQKVSATGVIDAETGARVKIGSQITGRIKRLYADIDSKVTAGQVIAELDAPDLAANLNASRHNYENNNAKYQQQLEGVGMQHTQVASAFEQAGENIRIAESRRAQSVSSLESAKARLRTAQSSVTGATARQQAAEAKLRSAVAAAKQQPEQTSSDISRAKSALSTAQSALAQVQRTAALQVSNAEAALHQAEANAALAASNYKRQEGLLAKGYLAPSDVDATRTQRDTTAQQVSAASDTVRITKEKVTADEQSAKNAVDQAQAALSAAQAGSYSDVMRTEDVRSAESSLEDVKASVVQARIAVESANSDVEAARSAVRSAEGDIRNARYAQDTALANMTQDKLKQKDVKAAYETMQQSQSQVKLQEANFDKSLIRTPISGTVITLTQQQGETVAAGLAAPTLIEVCDLDRLQANTYVDETDISKIKVGMDASVLVDAYPNRPFTGKVSKIASSATMQQNVTTYLVTVDLDKYPPGLLKPQMTTTTQITIMEKVNVTLVANEAVKQGAGGEAQVVVMKNDVPEVRPIETGLTDGSFTEIKSGLQDGETVVIAGFDKLGIQGFGGAAGVPGFMQRTPFGTAAPKGGGKGGK